MEQGGGSGKCKDNRDRQGESSCDEGLPPDLQACSLYPTPQTVFTYMGRRGSGSIFSRSRHTKADTVVVPHGAW